MRGFIWDIPILIFASVLLWGPLISLEGLARVQSVVSRLPVQGSGLIGFPRDSSIP